MRARSGFVRFCRLMQAKRQAAKVWNARDQIGNQFHAKTLILALVCGRNDKNMYEMFSKSGKRRDVDRWRSSELVNRRFRPEYVSR
eukprot:6209023-Pleurochrysis_carterae.AAC.1